MEAVQSYTITAPEIAGSQLGSLIITRLAPAGSHVKEGGLLAQFDDTAQRRDFLDKQAEYQDGLDQINKKQAQQEADLAKDQTDLKQAQDALLIARLEMRKNEVLSRIDAEKNHENLLEAQANLKQLRATFDLKRVAAQADLHTLEIKRDRARAAMLHAQQNARKMTIFSPFDGLVVLNSIWRSGRMAQVQEGDEVRAGVSFMQVVDPGRMQVSAQVNQEDFPRLHLGQPVEVHLDAYPSLAFHGHVTQLAAVGLTSELSDRVRTFNTRFSIEGTDPRLLPDLTAAVDVELDRRPNSLMAPRQAIRWDHGNPYVNVKKGLGFDRQGVTLGPENDIVAVITSGVKQGEEVRLND
ncbi:MAG: efflux RND transporter periplasmic adaptor subunit [Terriglobia bacterium]